MTVTDLLKVLLELDQQCLTSRPSPWGEAAELVAMLAEHAEVYRDDLGDWRSVDLSAARKPAPRQLSQPALDAILALEPVPIGLKPTDRGYLRGDFRDMDDEQCSIQESSLVAPDALWLGNDMPHGRMHLDRRTAAALLPLLETFVRSGVLKGPSNA